MKKTVQLNTYNNDHFNPGAGKIKRGLWHIVNAVFFNSFFHFYGLKVALLKLFGAEIGINVLIKPYVNIKYPWNLIIGNDVWIGKMFGSIISKRYKLAIVSAFLRALFCCVVITIIKNLHSI